MSEDKVRTEEISEYDALITRSKTHARLPDDKKKGQTKSRKSERGKHIITCQEHIKLQQVPLGCSDCVVFHKNSLLPNGKLPTNGQVLAYYFTVNQENPSYSNLENICLDIMLHWISCNVYTVTRKTVRRKLEEIVETYKDLKKVPKAKRGETFYLRLQNFKSNCEALFDIKCQDEERIKSQQSLWGVKETNIDNEFYKNQLERKVNC